MIVEHVCQSPEHTLRKEPQDAIELIEGRGVAGDAHCGETVKHRSRVRQDPTQPNLRQVHLIHAELHDELAARGMPVEPGQMGENITTRGVDLLTFPVGTLLRIGSEVHVRLTGLRNPCTQLDSIHAGLMKATLHRHEDGTLERKAGVMGIVVRGGAVRPGDSIFADLPPEPHQPLDRV